MSEEKKGLHPFIVWAIGIIIILSVVFYSFFAGIELNMIHFIIIGVVVSSIQFFLKKEEN